MLALPSCWLRFLTGAQSLKSEMINMSSFLPEYFIFISHTNAPTPVSMACSRLTVSVLHTHALHFTVPHAVIILVPLQRLIVPRCSCIRVSPIGFLDTADRSIIRPY